MKIEEMVSDALAETNDNREESVKTRVKVLVNTILDSQQSIKNHEKTIAVCKEDLKKLDAPEIATMDL